MQAGGEILFGRIAIELGYLKSLQLEEAIREQERAGDGSQTSLGYLLLKKKLLTPEQIDQILGIQRENIANRESSGRSTTASLFGRIVVSQGHASQRQVNECLRDQELFARKGYDFMLGELLVKKGFLSAEDVHGILSLQNKSIRICPQCFLTYNVAGEDAGREFRCAKCQALLQAKPAAG